VANEITLTCSLSVFKPAVMTTAFSRAVTGLLVTMTGNYVSYGVILVATGGTAFPLGQVTAPHWAYFANMDATNYFTLRNGSGGADVCEFFPGEESPVPLLTTSTPYGVAHTAAVLVEYIIISY